MVPDENCARIIDVVKTTFFLGYQKFSVREQYLSFLMHADGQFMDPIMRKNASFNGEFQSVYDEAEATIVAFREADANAFIMQFHVRMKLITDKIGADFAFDGQNLRKQMERFCQKHMNDGKKLMENALASMKH